MMQSSVCKPEGAVCATPAFLANGSDVSVKRSNECNGPTVDCTMRLRNAKNGWANDNELVSETIVASVETNAGVSTHANSMQSCVPERVCPSKRSCDHACAACVSLRCAGVFVRARGLVCLCVHPRACMHEHVWHCTGERLRACMHACSLPACMPQCMRARATTFTLCNGCLGLRPRTRACFRMRMRASVPA